MSVAITPLNEINVATSPTVHRGGPPRKIGQVLAIPKKGGESLKDLYVFEI